MHCGKIYFLFPKGTVHSKLENEIVFLLQNDRIMKKVEKNTFLQKSSNFQSWICHPNKVNYQIQKFMWCLCKKAS